MPRKRRPYCLLVGDTEHVELRPSAGWLAEEVQVTRSATPKLAVAAAKTLPPFDLIVVAQTRPGQFSMNEVEALHRAWPLAKLLGLLGSWCEGEGRSGRPWPGVWRVAASHFILRLRELLSQEMPRRSRIWQLPRLTSDAERFYCDAALPILNGSGVVLIAANSRDAFESFVDAVRQAGFTARWQPPNRAYGESGISAAIWDASRGADEEWQAIRDFVQSVNPAPVLVSLGFPRNDDFLRARRLSTLIFGNPDKISVLAKPLRLADLCGELVRLTGITVTKEPRIAPGADRKEPRDHTPATDYDACERPQSKSA